LNAFNAEGGEGDKTMGKMIIFLGLACAVTLGALFLAGMLNGLTG
jgi:hypothetical protein